MTRKLTLLLALILTVAAGGQSALGGSPGPLSANPDPIAFNTIAVGDSPTISVTIRNEGGTTVAISNVATSNGGGDLSAGGGCDGATLNPNDTCDVNVTYSPSASGSLDPAASLDVTDDDASSPQHFAIQGSAVVPVDIQPLDLAFGDQHVGTNSAALPVTVTNHRSQAITVDISNGNPADYGVSGCVDPLAAGDSCTIQVIFSPNAIGQQNGTLTVEGHAIQLTGRGTAAVVGIAPGSLSFGNQPVFTSSEIRTVTVTNTGNESLHVAPPTVSGNAAQFLISDNCQLASPVAPGSQCTITVQFAPSAVGIMDAILQVNSDATNDPQTVDLHGTATPSAVVFVPGPVPFKRPHHAGTFSSPKTITLTNRTNTGLTISRVHLGGQNPKSFRITAGNCAGTTVAPDQSCSETVRFAPNEVGVKGATLTVNDNGPNSPHSVALTGTATYPKDDVAVHGAVGCDAVKITWKRAGTSSRFARTVIVRSRTHIPTGPDDGTRLAHGAGVLHDRGLRHFTAYEYRVFALYHSRTRPGTFNHSRGVVLRERTGEICTPKDNGIISDTTPTATWLKRNTLFGYSFRLFHAGDEVQQVRSVHARSFHFGGRRHLRHGFTYTLFLYAYPPAKPEGTLIGTTVFRVR